MSCIQGCDAVATDRPSVDDIDDRIGEVLGGAEVLWDMMTSTVDERIAWTVRQILNHAIELKREFEAMGLRGGTA
jgi:hypothetical protein